MEIDSFLLKVEKNLMLGAGRWVAEFNESFREFAAGKHSFDLYVRGSVRTKGLLLSRLFAYFSLPDYNVAFYAKHVPEDDFNLGELCKAVEDRAAKGNVKWTWLVLLRSGSFPRQLVEKVDSFNKPELGITLVNVAEQDIDTSSNILGRKALSLVRVFKQGAESASRRTTPALGAQAPGRVSRLHFGDIGKSFSVAFILVTVIWAVVSHYSLGRIYVSWQILLGNIAVSAMFSAVFYKFRYHRILEYDDKIFALRIGRTTLAGEWADFSFVSLYHKGYGVFAIRLYLGGPDSSDFVELPATDLGLDPSAFRFEIAQYLQHG